MRRHLFILIAFVGLAAAAWASPARAADSPTSGTFDSKGVKIAYTVRGKGEPVVLIHGWLSSGFFNWTLPGTTALLAKDFQVVTIDMPGHGQSDKPTKDEAYGPELVEHVIRLMDHLKIKKAHIVGYSMGGIITRKATSHASGSRALGDARRHGLAAREEARSRSSSPPARATSRWASVSAALAKAGTERKGDQVDRRAGGSAVRR